MLGAIMLNVVMLSLLIVNPMLSVSITPIMLSINNAVTNKIIRASSLC
jgi:hypothetical protein